MAAHLQRQQPVALGLGEVAHRLAGLAPLDFETSVRVGEQQPVAHSVSEVDFEALVVVRYAFDGVGALADVSVKGLDFLEREVAPGMEQAASLQRAPHDAVIAPRGLGYVARVYAPFYPVERITLAGAVYLSAQGLEAEGLPRAQFIGGSPHALQHRADCRGARFRVETAAHRLRFCYPL